MPPKLVHTSAALALRDDGTLRIGVVADTHSLPHRAGMGHLAALAPDVILHGGDIGELQVLDELRAIAPVIAVRGNIDTRAPELPDSITIDLAGRLRILLTHIALYGPKLRGEIAKLAHRERAAMVVCGHSHVPFIGSDKGLTVFNPGSIGPRRFALPILFGSIDIGGDGKLRMAHLSAETGARWLPP